MEREGQRERQRGEDREREIMRTAVCMDIIQVLGNELHANNTQATPLPKLCEPYV
jgi:hypothetical protein